MENRVGKFYYHTINKKVETYIKISQCGTLAILFTRAGSKEFRLEIVPVRKFLASFFDKEISSEEFNQKTGYILKGFEKESICITLKNQ